MNKDEVKLSYPQIAQIAQIFLGVFCTGKTVALAAKARRASNMEAQGERSEAQGEAYNNFEPRQG
ncbi:MAG: hypothetical protein GX574_16770 [Lentisphaerae bacterium]|jgi:hypothetical protein|nr:hypothetical protein [Lentisphaerota bacterium]OQC17456.1 MAG: hypothetical protein BWX73_00278 [Lentisphaerae bacterium ADurb.Bin082]